MIYYDYLYITCINMYMSLCMRMRMGYIGVCLCVIGVCMYLCAAYS